MVPWRCKLAHYQCLKGNDDMLIIQSTNVMSHFLFLYNSISRVPDLLSYVYTNKKFDESK